MTSSYDVWADGVDAKHFKAAEAERAEKKALESRREKDSEMVKRDVELVAFHGACHLANAIVGGAGEKKALERADGSINIPQPAFAVWRSCEVHPDSVRKVLLSVRQSSGFYVSIVFFDGAFWRLDGGDRYEGGINRGMWCELPPSPHDENLKIVPKPT